MGKHSLSFESEPTLIIGCFSKFVDTTITLKWVSDPGKEYNAAEDAAKKLSNEIVYSQFE